nr:hypothetical protein [Nanoarchaeum sp.]
MISSNSKSWIPFIFLIVLIGFVIVYVSFGDLFSATRQPVQPSPGCVAIQDNGDSENKIDIVFLPDNFQDAGKFREKTDEMVNTFLSTKPFSEHKESFNFFRIEQFDLDLKCDYEYGGDAIVCDPSAAKSSATLCPHDYVIVAVDSEGIQKLFDLLRSSAWMGIASLNTADDPLVFSHEFAHIFANFADEYEYGGKITWDAPNCDSTWQTCPKFSSVSNSECIQGCVNNENSRSVNVGIMRDYWKSKSYGQYNEYALTSYISKSVESSLDSKIAKSMPINSVELSFVDNQWRILEVKETTGYPDGLNTGVSSKYTLSVQGEETNNLFEINLPIPLLYFDGHDNESNPYYNVSLPNVTSYLVNIPKIEKESRIIVKENDVITSAFNFNQIESMSYNSRSLEIPQTFSSS